VIGAAGDGGLGRGNWFFTPAPLYLALTPAELDEPGEADWLSLVQHVVMPAAREFGPELILVSAGFDAHRADPLANCRLEADSFAQLAAHVRELASALDVPAGLVLEGGYDLDALSQSVVATLGALANGGAPPREVERDGISDQAATVIGRYWRL
jgi:acetoin utilization deacetylase AcuC-like enzyme